MKYSEEDAEQLRANIANARLRLSPPAEREPAKASKYHNEPTCLDGFNFASKKEAARYTHLKALQAIGTIKGLQVQYPFALMVEGVEVAKYVADFTYTMATGEGVIEDVKGGAVTQVFALKKKIMSAMGYRVREVRSATRPAGFDECDVKKLRRAA